MCGYAICLRVSHEHAMLWMPLNHAHDVRHRRKVVNYRMSEDEQEHDDMRRIREACEVLSEHFDSVQIFATRHEMGTDDGTVNVSYGVGNWFARYGQIHQWMNDLMFD